MKNGGREMQGFRSPPSTPMGLMRERDRQRVDQLRKYGVEVLARYLAERCLLRMSELESIRATVDAEKGLRLMDEAIEQFKRRPPILGAEYKAAQRLFDTGSLLCRRASKRRQAIREGKTA